MKAHEKLLLENKAWAQEKLQIDGKFFENSMREEHPNYLWIGCSDSRIPVNIITNSEPGDIHVHRNYGNIVSLNDSNLMSLVQHAVEDLDVHHIIVCGHSHCDAIQSAINHRHHGLLNKWLAPIKETYHKHESVLSEKSNQVAAANKLSELHIVEQAYNLAKTSIIQHAWLKKKRPCVHGWHYDMSTGLLKELVKLDHIEQIPDVFRFDFSRNPDHYGYY